MCKHLSNYSPKETFLFEGQENDYVCKHLLSLSGKLLQATLLLSITLLWCQLATNFPLDNDQNLLKHSADHKLLHNKNTSDMQRCGKCVHLGLYCKNVV